MMDMMNRSQKTRQKGRFQASRWQKLRSAASVLMALLLCVSTLLGTAPVARAADGDTLTIKVPADLVDKFTDPTKVELQVYLIGSKGPTGWALDAAYQQVVDDAGLPWNEPSPTRAQVSAATPYFEDYIDSEGIAPAGSGNFSADGVVSFKLDPGYYLVRKAVPADPNEELPESKEFNMHAFLILLETQVVAEAKVEYNKIEKTKITVKKIWQDGKDNQHRPDDLKVTLYANGEKVTKIQGEAITDNPATLNAENEWTYTWNDLYVYDAVYDYDSDKDAKTPIPITYSVEETREDSWKDYYDEPTYTPESQTAEKAGENGISFQIENPHKKGSLKITKEVTVTEDGETSSTKTTVADGVYEFTVSDGPVDEPDRTVTITIENGVASTATLNDLWCGEYTITETTPTNGTKLSKIVVNGVEYQGSATVTVEAGETAETAKATFTNDREITNVSVLKVWEDEDNLYGKRPEPQQAVAVLKSNGTAISNMTLNDDNNWTYTWTNLPKADAEGKDIEYTVDEVHINNYTATVEKIEGEAAFNFKITNFYPTGSLEINKEITVNGKPVADAKDKTVADGTYNFDVVGPNNYTTTVPIEVKEGVAEGPAVLKELWPGEYTVTEQAPGNGTYLTGDTSFTLTVDKSEISEELGNTCTFVNNIDFTEYPFEKVWDDDDDEAGLRPESIEVQLYSEVNGEKKPYGAPVTLTSENASEDDPNVWTYTWLDLPVHASDGTSEYVYTVDETELEDYKKVINGNTITNVVPRGMLTLTKQVTVTGSDGKPTTTTTTVADGTYTFNVKNAASNPHKLNETLEIKVENGQASSDYLNNLWTGDYVITETAPTNGTELEKVEVDGKEVEYDNGITVSVVGGEEGDEPTSVEVTFTNDIDVVEVKVEKFWDDNSNFDGGRASQIKLQLLAGGNPYGDQVVLTADDAEEGIENTWSYTWTELPKYQPNTDTEVVYTVEEEAVIGYEEPIIVKQESGEADVNIRIENPRRGCLEIVKEVTVNGKATTGTEADGTYEFEVTGPDGYTSTQKITIKGGVSDSVVIEDLLPGKYTVTEKAPGNHTFIAKADGEVSVEGDNADDPTQAKITNNIDFTTREVEKEWDDDDDAAGRRPSSVTVKLLADGTVLDSQVLNEDNDWSYKWEGLYKHLEDGETEIVYTVEEVPVDEYEPVNNPFETDDDSKVTITNVIPRGMLKLTKKVTASGNSTTSTVADGTYTFEVKNAESNDHPFSATLSIVVKNGKAQSEPYLNYLWPGDYVVTEVEPTNGTELKKVEVDGVAAADPKNVTVTVVDKAAVSVTFTNDIEVTSISVTKKWAGETSSASRPSSIYVNLLAGSVVKDAQKLSASNNWTYTWNNLPAKDEDGKKITYKVSEVEVKGYISKGPATTSGTAASNFAITNTFVTPTPTPTITNPPGPPSDPTPTPPPTPTAPPTTEINGQKIWNDEDNRYGTRPDNITVELLGDGVVVSSNPIWRSRTGNTWSYSFVNLPVYNRNDEVIEYTVRELPVEGYTTRVEGYIINNDLIPRSPSEYTNISGVKIWNDGNNATGARPNYITVRLYRNGVEIEQRTVTAANEWQYTFQNLPLDDGYGNTFTYSISEDTVPGYFTLLNGNNFTNTLLPETIEDNETPLGANSEEELENLVDLFDYGTPLFGELLKTGDETPMYPYIFASIGALAIVILLVAGRRKRRLE